MLASCTALKELAREGQPCLFMLIKPKSSPWHPPWPHAKPRNPLVDLLNFLLTIYWGEMHLCLRAQANCARICRIHGHAQLTLRESSSRSRFHCTTSACSKTCLPQGSLLSVLCQHDLHSLCRFGTFSNLSKPSSNIYQLHQAPLICGWLPATGRLAVCDFI